MGFSTNTSSRDIHPVYGTRRKNRLLRTIGFAGSLTAHNIILYLLVLNLKMKPFNSRAGRGCVAQSLLAFYVSFIIIEMVNTVYVVAIFSERVRRVKLSFAQRSTNRYVLT